MPGILCLNFGPKKEHSNTHAQNRRKWHSNPIQKRILEDQSWKRFGEGNFRMKETLEAPLMKLKIKL